MADVERDFRHLQAAYNSEAVVSRRLREELPLNDFITYLATSD